MTATSLLFVNPIANNWQLNVGLSTSLITLSHKGHRKETRARLLDRTNVSPPPNGFLMDSQDGPSLQQNGCSRECRLTGLGSKPKPAFDLSFRIHQLSGPGDVTRPLCAFKIPVPMRKD